MARGILGTYGKRTEGHLGRKVGRERYSATGSYFGREMSREGVGVSHDVEQEELAEMMSQYPGGRSYD